MPTAVGVHVHFLQKREVGVKLAHARGHGGDVFLHRRFGKGAGVLAAVHEEAEIVGIGAKAEVPRKQRVFPPRFHGLHGVLRNVQRQIVLDALHVQKHIGRVGQ